MAIRLGGPSQQTGAASEDHARWIVMVFMGAERVPGEADLLTAALDDIDEMQKLYEESVDGPLDLFVQLHSDGVPWRRRIGKSDRIDVPEGERDTANGQALLAFMQWAVSTAELQETDRLLLVLWGHSYEFAIGRSESPSGIQALDFAELADVLAKFHKKHERKLDIVGFDACDLATIEMAYQFREHADYLLASEIGIPVPGWPYNRVFDRIKVPEGRQMGPAELGSYIVRRYCETYRADHLTVSLSLLDLRQAENVAGLTETLSRRLAIAMAADPDETDLISDLFGQSQTSDGKPFVDAADLCLNLARHCSDAPVRQAAEKLGDFLLSARPAEPGQSETGSGRPFVAEHGRNACQTARLQGVSLYAPHLDPAHDFELAGSFYGELAFAKATLWGGVVDALVVHALS